MAQLEALDRRLLTDLAHRCLGSERADVGDWSVRPIKYDATNPVSQGVYRVAGAAKDADREVAWSLVLKVVQSPHGIEDRPGYWPDVYFPREGVDSPPMYWKREILAYESGLLDNLPDGLSAPRCFAVVEQSPSVYWLWLEDVVDAHDGRWTLDRYAEAARQIGRFNGGYLRGRTLSDYPWMRYGWQGASHVIRFGYAASTALRYGCLTAAVMLLNLLGPHLQATMEERRREPIEKILEQEAARFSLYLDIADEARALLQQI